MRRPSTLAFSADIARLRNTLLAKGFTREAHCECGKPAVRGSNQCEACQPTNEAAPYQESPRHV